MLLVRVANFILKRLAVIKPTGVFPPASDITYRHVDEASGAELTMCSNGDTISFIIGKREFYVQKTSPQAALRLAWFILWRWWARGTWCGIKLKLWDWALSTRLDSLRGSYGQAKGKEKAKARH